MIKQNTRDHSSTSDCKGYYLDRKNKRIFLFYKYYENSLRNFISLNRISDKSKNTILTNLINCILAYHSNMIFSLNLTFDNIKLTKKNFFKFVSFKNTVNLNSNDDFVKQNYSNFHFLNLFNVKINLPPEFYEIDKKIIRNLINSTPNTSSEAKLFYTEFENNNTKLDDLFKNNNYIWGIDIWSLAVIISFIFSAKSKFQNITNFYEIEKIENDMNETNSKKLRKLDIYELFYNTKKIYPESIFTNIDINNYYIRAIIVGMLRYDVKERPSIYEAVDIFNEYLKNQGEASTELLEYDSKKMSGTNI